MTVKKISEHEIQVYVCNYLRKKNIKFWAVPNGFIHNGDKTQTMRYMQYMRAEGMTRGVFDITILLGDGKVAFMELKTIHGKPSEYQLEWYKYFQENNYPSRICKGLKECIEFIDELIVQNEK